VLYAFGLHLHQPVGNFDAVFEQHLVDVYRPLLAALQRGGAFPATIHVSGPLLDWLEARGADWLDHLGRLAADEQVELLASGFDEPILAALTSDDRLEQVARMRERLRRRFGVDARGLWLTERVWEPDLAADLARAGIHYVLVDDRHFLAAGLERDALHLPWRTEAEGWGIAVLPIDERLRYLIPFRPVEEFAAYVRDLRARGLRLALLADDGEKFGGWPGTREWVYERGWLAAYLDTLAALRDAGEIELVTCGGAAARLPSAGLVYLPSASYREMEAWALPAPAAQRLAALETALGDRIEGPDGALVRGTHWRSFLAKYTEANRMHKKMLRLSRLARERGEREEIRRAIGRAQCNDAYWHGVFGGLYLPFLRAAVWANLADAERMLRAGERLGAEMEDVDFDGHAEVNVHGAAFAAIVAPARGGGIEELTVFAARSNLADVLSRRREAYHAAPADARPEPAAGADAGMRSIHDLEKRLSLETLPPEDGEPRAIFLERLVRGEPDAATLAAGEAVVVRSWAAERFAATIDRPPGAVEVGLAAPGLEKRLRFDEDGSVTATFAWTLGDSTCWVTTELSVAGSVRLESDAGGEWRYPIETVAKSERGLERTVQGEAVVLGWPAERGRGWVRLRGGTHAGSE